MEPFKSFYLADRYTGVKDRYKTTLRAHAIQHDVVTSHCEVAIRVP